MRAPEARNSLDQHGAAGGVLGRVGEFMGVPEARKHFAAAFLHLRALPIIETLYRAASLIGLNVNARMTNVSMTNQCCRGSLA